MRHRKFESCSNRMFWPQRRDRKDKSSPHLPRYNNLIGLDNNCKFLSCWINGILRNELNCTRAFLIFCSNRNSAPPPTPINRHRQSSAFLRSLQKSGITKWSAICFSWIGEREGQPVHRSTTFNKILSSRLPSHGHEDATQIWNDALIGFVFLKHKIAIWSDTPRFNLRINPSIDVRINFSFRPLRCVALR